MRASYHWLKELTGLDASPEEMAEKLTAVGLEVEAIERFPAPEKVVVAEVRGIRPHPKRDKLRLVTLFDGSAEDEIVCGAPNVPDPGGRVLFAQLGAALPTEEGEPFVISERAIGGVPSRGMICSESELGIGAGGEGIFVFDGASGVAEAPAPGTPLGDALPVGDAVFEIGLTPNRPDCLGHVGIARDLCAIYGAPFTPPVPPLRAEGATAIVPASDARFSLAWAEGGREVAYDGAGGPVSVTIADAERCPRYGAAVVLGARVGPSPFWLRYRLHVLGLRSISNLVDATNLVMLERGHPIHGFDLEKVRGRRIDVRLATDGETLETLDGETRALTADDLLICDGEGPVALAGVMGGANSEIGDATTNLLIECAYFDPRSVRRTSRRTGLHTDASHRFERGVDPNAVPAVLARAAQLMAELGGGVALAEGMDVVAKAHEAPRITLRRARLDALLGYAVPKDVPAQVLAALGCTDVEDGEDAITVSAPSWRPDLGREVDLIEEVARIHGYEHVPTAVPRVRPSATGTAPRIRFERALRERAAAAGLFEAVSYSFVSPGELEAARASTEVVGLANPLSEERSVMRTALLPGLLAAARQALRRQARDVLLFELGRVFAPTGERLPRERPRLGILVAGQTEGWIGAERARDFYDLKGFVEAVLAPGALAPTLAAGAADAPWLHPKRQATLHVGDTPVGTLGELHPEVADAFELEGVRLQFADLDVEALFAAAEAQGVPQAPALARFPSATRDVAMLVAEAVEAGTVAETLAAAGGGLVEDVALFDLYRGENVPAGQKSLAFRVTYRDAEATLTDKRVDKAHAKVRKAAEATLGATLR